MTDQNQRQQVNAAGLSRADYRGAPSTLCQGCGHNGIASQIVAACYELDIVPEQVVKFSGIGCSSKSPTYFLSRSFGFNGLHGRMPSLALGALFADTSLKGIGVSGDGDTTVLAWGNSSILSGAIFPWCTWLKQRRLWINKGAIFSHSRARVGIEAAGY